MVVLLVGRSEELLVTQVTEFIISLILEILNLVISEFCMCFFNIFVCPFFYTIQGKDADNSVVLIVICFLVVFFQKTQLKLNVASLILLFMIQSTSGKKRNDDKLIIVLSEVVLILSNFFLFYLVMLAQSRKQSKKLGKTTHQIILSQFHLKSLYNVLTNHVSSSYSINLNATS